MKKDNKKRNKKIALICLGIFLILSGFASMDTKEGFGFIVFCLLFIVAGAVLLFLAFKKPKNKEEKQQTNILVTPQQNSSVKQQPTNATAAEPAKTTVTAADILNADDRDRNLFKVITDGHYLAYSYERDFCLIDDGTQEEKLKKLSGNGGKEIEFKKEPENQHDSNAVAIYFNNEKIGYVYKGQTQDMVNDWLNKEKKPLLGYINRILIDEGKATYKVGFYKPLDNCESKSFAITKSTSKERQETLGYCSEGDSVSVDSYGIVYDDIGNELGEAPQSFKNYIEDKNYKKIIGVIDEIEVTDNLKHKATVTVYII